MDISEWRIYSCPVKFQGKHNNNFKTKRWQWLNYANDVDAFWSICRRFRVTVKKFKNVQACPEDGNVSSCWRYYLPAKLWYRWYFSKQTSSDSVHWLCLIFFTILWILLLYFCNCWDLWIYVRHMSMYISLSYEKDWIIKHIGYFVCENTNWKVI